MKTIKYSSLNELAKLAGLKITESKKTLTESDTLSVSEHGTGADKFEILYNEEGNHTAQGYLDSMYKWCDTVEALDDLFSESELQAFADKAGADNVWGADEVYAGGNIPKAKLKELVKSLIEKEKAEDGTLDLRDL